MNNSHRWKKKIISCYLEKKKFSRLHVGKISTGGRNYQGKITVRHRGSGIKKNLIIVDFYRRWTYEPSVCVNITKDSNRTCFVALLKYSNGTYSYILAPQYLRPGFLFLPIYKSEEYLEIRDYSGHIIMFNCIYTSIFFNLEINPVKGGQYSRAAGTFCKVLSINFVKSTARIQLPTGLIRLISIFSVATLGRASNSDHCIEFFSKAGFFRKKNWRPTVRGVAMNPVDHPHGGRTKTNSPELTPWGRIAKLNK